MVGWPLKMAQLTSNKILDLISDNDFIGYVGLAEEPKYIDDVKVQITELSLTILDFTFFVISYII